MLWKQVSPEFGTFFPLKRNSHTDILYMFVALLNGFDRQNELIDFFAGNVFL